MNADNDQRDTSAGGATGPPQDGRQRVEEELRRRNRTLVMLNRAHQILIHATQEPELLEAICRIAVEDGGYRMAWVGYAEQDEHKSVRPVAQTGFAEGYLRTAGITWADAERGRGPTGVAIRTGKPTLARSIAGDPNFEPWREAAIQRGYLSSIALPLSAGGTVFGALNVYAMEQDAFDAEEIGLLVGLAENLAYGITSLRAWAALQRAAAALRESEAMLQGLLESYPEPVQLVAADGTILYANRTSAARLQTRAEDLIGGCLYDSLPPDGVAPRRARIAEAVAGGKTVRFQEVQAGRFMDHYICPVLDCAGAVTRLALIGIDVTEHKQMEEALARSEAGYRRLADNAIIGICRTAVHGGVLYANEALLRLLGFEAMEEMNRDGFVDPYLDPADRTTIGELLREEGQVTNVEVVVATRNRETRIVLLSATMEGDIVTTMLIDITARKRAENRVAQQLRELQRLHDVSRGWEDRIRELKAEVNGLAKRLGKTIPYPSLGE